MKVAVSIFALLAILLPALPCIGESSESPFSFTLRSHEGREWSDKDFEDKQLVVVAFLGTECPLVKLYGPRLQELQNEFADDIAIVGMNSNTQDSITEINAFAIRHDIKYPLLKDVGNVVADQFAAKRTPEVFLLDKDRKVRYHGRIDDQYSVGEIRDDAETRDLKNAIKELLAGKDVSVPKTESVGCHIGRVQKVKPKGEITYSKHIAPIFFKHCLECHRDGELAPFPLASYDDVIGWEETICEVIEDNRMPPWFANPEHGKFKNDCRLSPEDKELVYQWVENGMPEGDAKDLPEPPTFSEGWRIPEPDQVFYMRDKPYKVKAQGTLSYKRFYVKTNWDEDKYLCAAEARPDNKSVVHHILVYVIPPEGRSRIGLDRVMVGYAPGSTPVILPEGVAMKIPKGSVLQFEMHYTPNGYVQEDRSYAGVKFIDKSKVKKIASGRIAINDNIRIPANAAKHEEVAPPYRVAADELLLSMTPHMHLRGASFKYEATYPDGTEEVLLDVPNYDFNWQLKYILEEPKLLPRGTTILCTATYNNSDSNPVNPDPNREVTWGDQSWQEMMIGFFDTIPPDEAEKTSNAKDVAIDPTGLFVFKGALPGKLKLSLENDVLTGTVTIRGGTDIPVDDLELTGDRLTFSLAPAMLRGMVLMADVKVTEDLLDGEIVTVLKSIGREVRKTPFSAKRQED